MKTVVVEGITKNIDTKDNRDNLVNWWRMKYPKYDLIDFKWGLNSANVRRLQNKLKLVKETIKLLESSEDHENSIFSFCCNQKDLDQYREMKSEIESCLQKEVESSRSHHLGILFLTYGSSEEAQQVVMKENGLISWSDREKHTERHVISLAPLPEDIIWENMRRYFLVLLLLKIRRAVHGECWET